MGGFTLSCAAGLFASLATSPAAQLSLGVPRAQHTHTR